MERYTRIRIIIIDSRNIHATAKSSHPSRWCEIETRRKKKRKRKAERETQIYIMRIAVPSRHKKHVYIHIMHSKNQKAKRKYLAPPRLRWYLHTQLLMRPNVTYLPCADGNGSIPRRMSARCQTGYKIKNIHFFIKTLTNSSIF